jgi:polyisoprenoid-binding protein YceI
MRFLDANSLLKSSCCCWALDGENRCGSTPTPDISAWATTRQRLELESRRPMTHSTVDEIRDFVAGTWEIDSLCSEVSFNMRLQTVRKAHGRLNRVKGTIVTDQDYGRSSVVATIDAASITTGGAKSDSHVRSERFLDVDKFPEIAFQSTDIVLDGPQCLVQGDLTIRGTTRALQLDVDRVGFTSESEGGTRACFSATTHVSRNDFGVRPRGLLALMDNALVLSDGVHITINIEAVLRSAS